MKELSICMIVGKEEHNVKRCLDSLLPLIHESWCELIIVVTQEGDRTMECCKEYTDNVYFQKWTGNFSFHRNYAISFATGKRIMTMDADEEVDQRTLYQLEDIILNPQHQNVGTVFLNMRNYYTADLKQYTMMMQARIFWNTGKPIYSGTVHNQPDAQPPYLFGDSIIINHYGYIYKSAPELERQKNDRTMSILLEDYKKDSHNLHTLTHLIKGFASHGDHKKVIEFSTAWIEEMSKAEFHEGWFAYLEGFNTIIVALLLSNLIDRALEVLKEAEKYSHRLPTLYAVIGNYYMKNNPELTCKYYKHVIEITSIEEKSPYEELLTTNIDIVVPNILNWLAVYHFSKGLYKEAGEYLNKGIILNDCRLNLRWDIWNEDSCVSRLSPSGESVLLKE